MKVRSRAELFLRDVGPEMFCPCASHKSKCELLCGGPENGLAYLYNVRWSRRKLISQLWKNSVEVEGTIRKRLTPAGWLSLGIALVGLLASVGSILVSVNIKKNAQLQAQAEAAQKLALQGQESRWRSETSSMLKLAKDDIEKNLGNTIAGFQDSQERFNSTQAQIISSKQSVL
ncbi:MAG TPA: hypothetical protein VN844_00595 [Pyrinomonadaceae bacterium]|nr:hypothetical protein [Pyrinomonadaceae bacterium]